jgi:ubiquinone/menaquinone biosynthesis C-methylase UbiE
MAAARARRRKVEAAFAVADAGALPLVSACAGGAMSVDALQYVPDKRVAFAEVRRVLGPGARFAFTAFEVEPARVAGLPVLGTDPIAEYAPVLEAAGFAVETVEETEAWADRLEATYRAVVAAQDALAVEMGDRGLAALLREVTLTLEVRPYRRRVLVASSAPR